MAADFRLKQNLKMSPSAQIKNLVPENLSDIPPQSEWKLGRFWFNTTIGKLQGVFLKLDRTTGIPLQPQEMEVRVVGADALGPTMDGSYWPDGLFDFTAQTKIADAMDDVNEALKDLAPAEATLLKGDLNLVDQTFLTGKISKQTPLAPDQLRMENVLEGSELNYIIKLPNIKATLPTVGVFVKGQQQQQFGKADQGVIVAVINDTPVDAGINLRNVFNEAGRDYFGVKQGYDPEITQSTYDIEGNELLVEINPNKDNYISSSGSLIINTVERYNEFKKWQRGAGTVNFTVTPGRHTLHVEHDVFVSGTHLNVEIPTNPFKTNTLEVFYDPNTDAPLSSISGFELKTGNTKYVSGIPYFNSNISFSFNYSATNAFTYTYWDKPISIVMDGSTHDLMDWNHTSSSLNGLSIPTWSDTFSLSSYSIAYNSPKTIVDNVKVTAKAGKPVTGWGNPATSTINLLIDTYPISGNSTTLKETFIDEEYRIRIESVNQDNVADVTAKSTGTWDSARSLTSGNAHQFMGSLIKAQNEFTMYNILTDYTSLTTVDQLYYRRIYAVGNKPNSNGIIKVKTNGIIGVDFDVFIKMPGVTAWLDTKELFDTVTFSSDFNVDGTGCASVVNKVTGGYELSWSVGTFSTVNSDYGYLVNIVLKTINCKIDELEEISETWR